MQDYTGELEQWLLKKGGGVYGPSFDRSKDFFNVNGDDLAREKRDMSEKEKVVSVFPYEHGKAHWYYRIPHGVESDADGSWDRLYEFMEAHK